MRSPRGRSTLGRGPLSGLGAPPRAAWDVASSPHIDAARPCPSVLGRPRSARHRRTVTVRTTKTRLTLAVAALSTFALAGCGEATPPKNALLESTPTASAPSTPAPAPSSSTPTTTPSTSSSSTSSSSSATSATKSATKAAEPTRTAERDRAARGADRPAISVRTVEDTRTLKFKTERRYDPQAAKGQVTVVREGVTGRAEVTLRQTVSGKKVVKTEVVDTDVTRKPVNRVVVIGTKVEERKETPKPTATAKPKPTEKPSPRPTPTQTEEPQEPTSGLNLARSAMWDRIAQCESTGNWSINTGNGYYGGLQFDIRTWLGAGGGDFAPRADLASRAEQITVANRVYAERGLQPWGCAGAA
ncbi:transglycosylase family protein [Barrientosiimonas humi]|uniref:resuscitation-promoting factor n=1 Tax=Barrientosiimonas humi TaxID=999931 RepID=UPI003B8485A2